MCAFLKEKGEEMVLAQLWLFSKVKHMQNKLADVRTVHKQRKVCSQV